MSTEGSPGGPPPIPPSRGAEEGEDWIIAFEHTTIEEGPPGRRRPKRTMKAMGAVPQPEVPGATVTLDVQDMEEVADLVPAARPAPSVKASLASAASPQPLPARTGEVLSGGVTIPDESPDDIQLKPGTMVFKYELIRRLGRGGMGTVWAAHDTSLGRKVAIKFLHKKASRKKEFKERFLVEARATAQFNHENIVTIHDAGEYAGLSYLVLEFLEGEPLSNRVKQRRVTPTQALQLMLPVVRALVEAHAAGIIHRDLKPDNVYLLNSGTVKVLDFGLAKLFDTEASAEGGEDRKANMAALAAAVAEDGSISDMSDPTVPSGSGKRRLHGGDSDLTRAGMIMGTYAYMSPEQWGLGHVDHQTDLWACGVILFEILTGEHPFGSRNTEVIMHNIARLNDPVRSVRDVVPTIPQDLANVVNKCLQKKKKGRFLNGKALLTALENLAVTPAQQASRARLKADENPYPGLAPFTENDANRFFGRDEEISQFIGKLKDRPTLAVIGPSGAGKSSFVRAGVFPALRAAGQADWDIMWCRPGRDPFAAVATAVLMGDPSEVSSVESVVEAAKEETTLKEQLRSEPGRLGAMLRARARSHGRPVLLYVDQFEELFTLVEDAEERDRFATSLASVAVDASTPVRVVVSMRSDFLDRVADNRALMDAITRDLTILQQPSSDGLREAIMKPAALAGFNFEDPAIVDDMVGSLENEAAALPLLQFAAQKLWDQRDKSRKMLTRASYDAMGGVEGALVNHADAVVQSMSPQDRNATRQLFQRLVTPEGTRAVLSLGEIRGLFQRSRHADRILSVLTEARLLTIQTLGEEAEEARVEIVHESLINRWQTLRRWLESGHEDAAMLAQLREAARQWDNRGRPTGLLWTGDAVAEARLWRKKSTAVLTPVEDDFLTACLRHDDRAARRKRILVGGAVILMALITLGAIVSLLAIRSAEKKAKYQAKVAVREADRASRAEADALDKKRRAEKAETLAVKQKTQVEQALAEVKQLRTRDLANQEKLKQSYLRVQRALGRAERERRRAQSATRRARRAARQAALSAKAELRARLAAERAQKELERLLEKERERVKRLMALRSKIITKLPPPQNARLRRKPSESGGGG